MNRGSQRILASIPIFIINVSFLGGKAFYIEKYK